jgi:hypothetical protein
MQRLTDTDIESELSYAYLHAVVSHVGAACQISTRSLDGNGIDASITAWAPFKDGGYLDEVTLHVQLKATRLEVPIAKGRISYFVRGKDRYEDLRKETLYVQRILVVLFLPPDIDSWLTVSEDQLLLRKCAYWVSLRGAPDPESTGKMVHIPLSQRFDAFNLSAIFGRLSRAEKLHYPLT